MSKWKARSGIYIKTGIKYVRRNELEGTNNGLVIIDLDLESQYRLINVNRVFNPLGGVTQLQYFQNQISQIETAIGNMGRRKNNPRRLQPWWTKKIPQWLHTGPLTYSMLALHLSGTPSLKTGTSPSSCLHLDNLLCMNEWMKSFILLINAAWH